MPRLKLSPSFPTQLFLEKQRISIGLASILTSASAHIANVLPTKAYFLVGSIYVLGAATKYYINHILLILNSLY